jgi:uncharacterized protein
MRNWGIGLFLAISSPAALSAQSVSYQQQLLSGEVVLNVSGTGSYIQRGNIANLTGQMSADAPSVVDADIINKQNFDLLVNSLGMLGVSPSQIRKINLPPAAQPAAGLARSVWQIYVELYDLTRMDEIISAMEGAEVRSIPPPKYDIADRNAPLVAARQRAIEDARRQAEAYATALTMTVRRISRVDEDSATFTTSANGSVANDSDVVATANVDVDFVLGPMFNPLTLTPTPTSAQSPTATE